MSAELMFWMVVLCAPGVVPAVIFYRRHCNERPRGENRFALGLYVVALLICAFVAFWVGTGWGVCSGPSWIIDLPRSKTRSAVMPGSGPFLRHQL